MTSWDGTYTYKKRNSSSKIGNLETRVRAEYDRAPITGDGGFINATDRVLLRSENATYLDGCRMTHREERFDRDAIHYEFDISQHIPFGGGKGLVCIEAPRSDIMRLGGESQWLIDIGAQYLADFIEKEVRGSIWHEEVTVSQYPGRKATGWYADEWRDSPEQRAADAVEAKLLAAQAEERRIQAERAKREAEESRLVEALVKDLAESSVPEQPLWGQF